MPALALLTEIEEHAKHSRHFWQRKERPMHVQSKLGMDQKRTSVTPERARKEKQRWKIGGTSANHTVVWWTDFVHEN